MVLPISVPVAVTNNLVMRAPDQGLERRLENNG
jgi:hypothetical protein